MKDVEYRLHHCLSRFNWSLLLNILLALVWFFSRIYWRSLDHNLMAGIWEKDISILAQNLNSNRSCMYAFLVIHVQDICSKLLVIIGREKLVCKLHNSLRTFEYFSSQKSRWIWREIDCKFNMKIYDTYYASYCSIAWR